MDRKLVSYVEPLDSIPWNKQPRNRTSFKPAFLLTQSSTAHANFPLPAHHQQNFIIGRATLPYTFRKGYSVACSTAIHISQGVFSGVQHCRTHSASSVQWRAALPYTFRKGYSVACSTAIHIPQGVFSAVKHCSTHSASSVQWRAALPYTFRKEYSVACRTAVHIPQVVFSGVQQIFCKECKVVCSNTVHIPQAVFSGVQQCRTHSTTSVQWRAAVPYTFRKQFSVACSIDVNVP
jgi:hypothetical protein